MRRALKAYTQSSTWSVPMPKHHVSSRLSCMYHSHCLHIVKTCVMSGELGQRPPLAEFNTISYDNHGGNQTSLTTHATWCSSCMQRASQIYSRHTPTTTGSLCARASRQPSAPRTLGAGHHGTILLWLLTQFEAFLIRMHV